MYKKSRKISCNWKLQLLERLKGQFEYETNKVLLLGVMVSYFINSERKHKSQVRREYEWCIMNGRNYYKTYLMLQYADILDRQSPLYTELDTYNIENRECVLSDGNSVFDLLDCYEYCNEEFVERENTITPTIVAWLMEELTQEEEKKKKGIFYTSPSVVRQMCETCISTYQEEKKEPECILDPAVGAGEFLVGMLKVLSEKDDHDRVSCKERVAKQLYGVDISPVACLITIIRLFIMCHVEEQTPFIRKGNKVFEHHIIWGDTLGIQRKVAGVKFYNQFSIVIGNPPYVDSETMKLDMPDARKKATENFQSAVGNWDLFVLFVERSIQLAMEGGMVHLLIPNRILYAEYSKAIRKMVHNLEVVEIMDYSTGKLFDQASVYPISILVKKSEKKSEEKRNVRIGKMYEDRQSKSEIAATAFYQDTNWESLFVMNKSEQRLMNKLMKKNYLYEVANVESAGSVKEAYEIKELIVEKGEDEGEYYKAVNTGTIDPFEPLWGKRKMKYIKQSYLTPMVEKQKLRNYSTRRYEQAKEEKIIIGGLNRRLECIYDEGSLLPCKSTVVIAKKSLALQYLCGLLNSAILSYYYTHYFHGCRVANGFYYIGVQQIRMIPIVIGNKEQQSEVIDCVTILEDAGIGVENRYNTLERLNHMVAILYGLTEEEEAMITQTLGEKAR